MCINVLMKKNKSSHNLKWIGHNWIISIFSLSILLLPIFFHFQVFFWRCSKTPSFSWSYCFVNLSFHHTREIISLQFSSNHFNFVVVRRAFLLCSQIILQHISLLIVLQSNDIRNDYLCLGYLRVRRFVFIALGDWNL